MGLTPTDNVPSHRWPSRSKPLIEKHQHRHRFQCGAGFTQKTFQGWVFPFENMVSPADRILIFDGETID
jgi:hypothetical protein